MPNSHTAPSRGRPKDKQSPRVTVIRHINRLLEQGILQPHEPLPSERSISKELGIHRTTVRRALAMLDDQGLTNLQRNGERVAVVKQSAKPANTGSVAVLMPDLGKIERGLHPHTQSGWAEVVGQHAVRALRRLSRGVSLPPSGLDWDKTVKHLLSVQPSGLLLADWAHFDDRVDEIATSLSILSCPKVVCAGHPRWEGMDRVTSDHRKGALELYRYLHRRGRRRVLMLRPQPSTGTQYWVEPRIAGYQEGVAEGGSDYRRVVVIPSQRTKVWRREGFEQYVRLILGELAEYITGPNAADAIMCPSDGQVFAVAAACRKVHLIPGSDLDIVGYDNYWRDCAERDFESYEPPVTVDKRNDQLGVEMAELLERRLNNQLPESPQLLHVEPELVV